MSVERWEAIWRACEESVARLLDVDPSPDGEWAAVIELVPPVEPEDES